MMTHFCALYISLYTIIVPRALKLFDCSEVTIEKCIIRQSECSFFSKGMHTLMVQTNMVVKTVKDVK